MPSTVRIGFVPLVDAAPLVLAQEKGFFLREGVGVELRKAQSWDQAVGWLVSGELQAAHMLITVPLQLALETGAASLVYGVSLGDHGNAVTVSNRLWRDGVRDSGTLREHLSRREGPPLRFAVVRPRSPQEYLLRLWLAKAGLVREESVSLRYLPPHVMVRALREGEIDGFCAGEPWNQRAAHSKLGYILATGPDLLPPMNEKVLAVRASWHREHAEEHAALIRAVRAAAAWLDDPANLDEAADLVCSRRFVNTARAPVRSALEGTLQAGGGRVLKPGGFLRMSGPDVNHPRPEHLRFYLGLMRRFGHLPLAGADAVKPEEICLEAFYRRAVEGGKTEERGEK